MLTWKDLDTLQVSTACLGLADCHYRVIILKCIKVTFPSLLALVGVVIEKRLNFLQKTFLINFLALSGNFEQLNFFPNFLTNIV